MSRRCREPHGCDGLSVQGGKVMFAATLTGGVRSYRVPLNGDFNEIRSHSGSITGLRLFFDDSLLFTVSDDGALFVFDVRTESRADVRRDLERLPFAEEVMVTKSDLEERRSRCCWIFCPTEWHRLVAMDHMPASWARASRLLVEQVSGVGDQVQ